MFEGIFALPNQIAVRLLWRNMIWKRSQAAIMRKSEETGYPFEMYMLGLCVLLSETASYRIYESREPKSAKHDAPMLWCSLM
jgi:hypothetical protein